MSIAQFIDHTILAPATTFAGIERVCEEAMEYGFAAVCIPPYFVKDASRILAKSKPAGRQAGPKVATVIGFPFGYSHYKAKLAEAEEALEDGAEELDLVMNIAAFKSKDFAWLETEINLVTNLAIEKKAIVKLIIESGILNEEEIIKSCEIYQHYPISFLKTSTGYAEKGASIEAVKLMRKHLPAHIGIKASGGVRSYEFAKQLLEAGATRLGCSASVAIVEGERELGIRDWVLGIG